MEKQCYELYVVQTDVLSEYTLDKIVMNEKEVEDFFKNYKEFDKIQITGLFGCQLEIQKSLISIYGINALNSNLVGKGKIFGIQQNSKAIICLILQEEFFLKKPIDEKSIQITLMRIFCDLTQNIQLCFSEKIFQNWYEGNYLPFSEINVLKRQEYIIDSTQNKEIDIQDFPLNIKNNYCKQVQFFQQNMTQYFLSGEVKKLTVQEQQQKIQGYINDIALRIQQSFEKKEQPQIQLLLEQHCQVQEQDQKEYIKKIVYQLEKEIKNIVQSNSKNFTDQLKGKVKKIVESQELKLQDKLQFAFKRQTCKIQRKVDQIQNEVSQINFELDETLYTQNFNFGFENYISIFGSQCWEKKNAITFQAAFRTKDNSELFIFLDEPKQQSCLYILPKNQVKWVSIGQIQKSDSAVFYFDQKNNFLFTFNAQNNKQITKFEISDKKILSQIVFCEQIYQKQEIIVNQVAYLSFTKNFLILYKESENNYQLYALNEESKQFSKISLKNQKKEQQLILLNVQLLACPSGKYFYLSNYQFCDMYDCNFTLVKTIELNGNLTVLSDNIDVFLLNLLNEKKNLNQKGNALRLTNVIELSSLRKVTDTKVILEGNPGLDLLKGSIAKFGPQSNFLSQLQNNRIQIFVKEISNYQKVNKYLTQLNLFNFEAQIFENPQYHFENYSTYKGICYSRVPIQLCTIENGSITPLIDGFRKDICLNEKIDISERAELLRFSFLEKYLTFLKEKIFVVCIIGKQSSGKSYLLNRIFGTRYSVAACRCTDGVWASFAKIEDQNFLILDCEGLFSSIRSQKEEVQLVALLTALSDVTILNQDLTFNRYLNDLLENLSAASDQLVGDTLFKGVLTIVLRDISASDNSGVDEELISNINKQKSGDNQEVVFIRKLFNCKFYVEKFFNFENKWFDDQILNFRNQFLKQSKETSRWLNGEQLISSLKILLCQLEMSDKTNSSLLQQQQKINRIFKSQKQVWLNYILSITTAESQEEDKNCNEEDQNIFDEQADTKIQIFWDPKCRNRLSQQIINKFIQKMKLINFTKDHNTNIKMANDYIQQETEKKKQELLELADSEFQEFNKQLEILEFFNSRKLQFLNDMQKSISSLIFCKEKCSTCFLKCTKFQIHDTESKLQFELVTIKILDIQSSLKEMSIISEEKFLELKQEFELNQQKQYQLQQNLRNYELYKQREQMKEQYQLLQILQECMNLIQIYLKIESGTNFLESLQFETQTLNFQYLIQGKQSLILKTVQFEEQINQLDDQIKRKTQDVQQYENQINSFTLNNKELQNVIRELELTTEGYKKLIQGKQESLEEQKQKNFYQNINKQYFEIIEIVNFQQEQLLLSELKQNQDSQISTLIKIDQLTQEKLNWLNDISVFQNEHQTSDEFFEHFKKYQKIQTQIEQKLQPRREELEKLKKNNRVQTVKTDIIRSQTTKINYKLNSILFNQNKNNQMKNMCKLYRFRNQQIMKVVLTKRRYSKNIELKRMRKWRNMKSKILNLKMKFYNQKYKKRAQNFTWNFQAQTNKLKMICRSSIVINKNWRIIIKNLFKFKVNHFNVKRK